METISWKRRLVGWIAVALTVIISGIWAYWGIVENFHEGWYSESLIDNILMLILQYLLITIVFSALAIISIRWRKIGLIIHAATGLFFAWFFNGASINVVGLLIVIPIFGFGLMYFYGRPEPRKWAYRIIIIIPIIIILSIAPFRLHKIAHRVNDGNYGMRLVEGNGVNLMWAPRGPGWPEGGVSYYEALERCRFLSEDGSTLMEVEQNIWRLPTVDESARSMMLHNQNAGGYWDQNTNQAVYVITPDKETPLWDPHSMIIYYWTQDNSNSDHAYIIVYDGGVYKRLKDKSYGYLSFRAVKEKEK